MDLFNRYKKIIFAGGITGILLFIRPLIFLFFSRRRDSAGDYGGVDATAMIFILYALVCFFSAFRELNKRKSVLGRYVLTRSSIAWLIAYTVLAGISMFWSINFKLTGFRAFECLAMLMTITVTLQNLFRYKNYKLVFQWTFLYVGFEIIVSLLRILQWTTDFYWIRTASQMSGTVFFFLAVYQQGPKLIRFLIILFSIISVSTVAYIGMALGLISVFWKQSKYRLVIFISGLFVIFTVCIIGIQPVLKHTIFFDKREISLKESSGRDEIMKIAQESLNENIWGYGFFSGEAYKIQSHFGKAGIINGHNSFFSAAMGIGWPGVVLMLIFFISMIRTVFSQYIPKQYRAALIGCFCVGFMQCMGNPGIGSRVYGSWMSVMFLFILICTIQIYEKYQFSNHENNLDNPQLPGL